MSSQNSYSRPAGGRPAANPADQDRSRQPSWVNPQAQSGYPQPSASAWPPQQPQASHDIYGQQPGYGQPQAPQQHGDYGHWGALQSGHQSAHNSGHQAGYPNTQGRQPGPAQTDPYAPQFEPYVAPGGSPYGHQATGYDQPSQTSQWPGRGGASDPSGYDAGGYSAPGYENAQGGQGGGFADPYRQESELSAADWAGQPSEFDHDGYQQGRGNTLGFATAEGGDLDPAYAEDDGEYEDEPAPRSRRPLMVVMALAGAILVGGGMAYGYKKFSSSGPQGEPPIIKSEDFPSKTKPADAGGKTFPYSDTKIMGRLGDGTATAAADGSPDQGAAAPEGDSAAAAPVDDASNNGGPRKVSTLVVGRDGSIQSPPPEAESHQVAAVPGTSLVDVFGQNGGGAPEHRRDEPLPQGRQTPVTSDDVPAPKKIAVTPVKINAPSAAKSSDGDGAAASAPVKKPKKVAKAETATASDAYSESGPPVTTSSTGTGFVAVLASVPHSASSRIDALKRFADMQQKYSSALAGKTPDIATANLGAKGNFDRLVVGPPGSRQEANSVCSGLKAQGYTNCWVTSY